MASSLVISLDFELMWGVRDHRSVADYGDAVLGVRTALPAILQRFADTGIHATWATVGLLFARNRREMLEHAPRVRPTYTLPNLSPYPFIENDIGADEGSDPLHYGRSLVDRIADTEGQEIATHTFSHYYCLEDGQTLESFRADLEAARSIAASAGQRVTSLVFPRNQMRDEHVACAREQGISCYRGNPGGYAYRSRSGRENTSLVRAVRLIDAVLPLTGSHSFGPVCSTAGVINVRASRFLRPWSPRMSRFSQMHVDHVLSEMRGAAMRGENYHLWWHPHNMGRNQEANLHQLDRILSEFRILRDRHGMKSRNMRDLSIEAAAAARVQK